MKKRLISIIVSTAMTMSAFAALAVPVGVSAADNDGARQMEKLNRGLVAVKTGKSGNGVYLSWRLLGDESLSNQAFAIYKNNKTDPIYTTAADGATNYTDPNGTATDKYKVLPVGASEAQIAAEPAVTPWDGSHYANYGDSTYALNQTSYIDIPVSPPGTIYEPNDMSVGDLDGDGEYEYILKWDPSDSQDNSYPGKTSNVYIDAYELDGTLMWRLDLGCNIRAGAHYTQFMVYDFDGDGCAEIAFKTAPGSKDGNGNYVSAVGNNITAGDDSKDYRTISDSNTDGMVLSGPEWLTIFNGKTGAAMQTVDYDPPRSIKPQSSKSSGWGDDYGNRSERYLAGVAYLDGKTPSLIECRGYYTYAYVTAYTWDGTNLTEQWISKNENGNSWVEDGKGNKIRTSKNKYSLYGQGAHSISVADVDNDGYDEIIFGSAVLDHDGTVLYSDGRGHGDALHVSDFDNDGNQEIFMVHEEGKGTKGTIPYAIDIKRYTNGTMTDVMKQGAEGDVGRGIIGNFVDQSDATAVFWSSSVNGVFKQDGTTYNNMTSRPANGTSFINFGIYWDGSLDWDLLDSNMLGKLTPTGMKRFLWGRNNASYFPGASANNDSKNTPCLSADIFGDWREEVIFKTGNDNLRIYMSCLPTDYRLTTLMHDSQYRCAVAWQNVGYNQPPHTSYYIGSASLASGKNYLDPAVEFTKVYYPGSVAFINRIADTLEISDGMLKGDIQAKLENYDDKAKLILAVYDDNKLIDIQLKDADGEVTFNVEIPDVTVYNYKIMAWNDLKNCEPLCEYKSK